MSPYNESKTMLYNIDDDDDDDDENVVACSEECDNTIEECKIPVDKPKYTRDLISFWIFGLVNNWSYVIMLSAAKDILHPHNGAPVAVSTGVILLADILPTLVIKLSAPLYMDRLSFRLRVSIVIIFALFSFIIVGATPSHYPLLSIFGVICASISAGFGEITFLSLSSRYHHNTVSTWSSGTGAAGALGSFSYLGITALLSPPHALFSMTVMPLLMLFVYAFLLTKPPDVPYSSNDLSSAADMSTTLIGDGSTFSNYKKIELSNVLTFKQKVSVLRPLLKYMVPLFVVYWSEYMINQGIIEHVCWAAPSVNCSGETGGNTKIGSLTLSILDQYRLFQAIYQVGVFLSRSSVNYLHIKKLWLVAVLQVVNFIVLMLDGRFQFIPSIWIMMVIILYEGFLGGLVYVNAFYSISLDAVPEYKEFSMGVASVADSFGIALAGASSQGINHLLKLSKSRP